SGGAASSPPWPSLDHLRGAQLAQLGIGQPELAQHLGRVLAEGGREAGDAGRRRRELDRRGERADAAAAVVPAFDDGRVRLDLRMREDLLQAIPAVCAVIALLEDADP